MRETIRPADLPHAPGAPKTVWAAWRGYGVRWDLAQLSPAALAHSHEDQSPGALIAPIIGLAI